ncbi:hypothetical protein BH18GEM1_BH18GEM1_15530 [soil metagenome]
MREFPLTVGPPPSGGLRLRAASSTLETGEAVPLALTVDGGAVAHPHWAVSPGGATVYPDHTLVAEEPGTYVFSATLCDRSARTSITVAPRDLQGGWVKVGRASAPVREIDVWVFEGLDGRDYAYTGSYGAQMRAYDVTDPASPVLTDSVMVPGRRVNDVLVSGDATFAVITQENDPDRHNGIIVLDLDPAHPTIAAHYWEGLTAGIHTTWIEDDLVYAVNDGTRDVHILDVSDIHHPREVGRWGLDTDRKALHDLMVADGLAYLSYWDDGLVILDVGAGIAHGTPTEPALVSRINYPAGNTHTAWRWKDYVFVGDEIFSSRYSPHAPSDPRGYIHVMDGPQRVGRRRRALRRLLSAWLEGRRSLRRRPERGPLPPGARDRLLPDRDERPGERGGAGTRQPDQRVYGRRAQGVCLRDRRQLGAVGDEARLPGRRRR